MNTFWCVRSMEFWITFWEFIATAACYRAKRKKKAAQILACCLQPPQLHTFKHQASRKKQEIQYLVAFMQIWHFPPRLFRGARFSVDHRYLPALLLRQQQQQPPPRPPLLHRLSVICYQQASKSKSWASPVPNLPQPCHVSNPSACRPISWLHLRDWIVVHSWHFFFIIIITRCYWRERLRARYNNSSIQNRTFLCFSPAWTLHFVYKERADFSASVLLMPANQSNP